MKERRSLPPHTRAETVLEAVGEAGGTAKVSSEKTEQRVVQPDAGTFVPDVASGLSNSSWR